MDQQRSRQLLLRILPSQTAGPDRLGYDPLLQSPSHRISCPISSGPVRHASGTSCMIRRDVVLLSTPAMQTDQEARHQSSSSATWIFLVSSSLGNNGRWSMCAASTSCAAPRCPHADGRTRDTDKRTIDVRAAPRSWKPLECMKY
jgi:hypothetical protein